MAVFTDSYIPQKNGVVTSVLQLRKGLIDLGHQVWVFTTRFPGTEEESDVFRFRCIPIQKSTESYLGFPSWEDAERKIKVLAVDIIHTHSEFSMGRLGKSLASRLNIPHVHTCHTIWSHYLHYLPITFRFKFIHDLWLKKFLKGIKWVIFPSAKAGKAYRNLHDAGIEFRIIPNGLDALAWIGPRGPECRERGGWWTVIVSGRISREKRVWELLEALLPLLRIRPEFRVKFVGDGPLRKKMEEYARSSGMGSQITFTGWVPWEEMPVHYSECRAYCSSSLSESGVNLAVTEAAFCGLPAVVRDDESFRELVRNGESGFCCSDDRSMAAALAQLMDSEALAISMGQSARRQAERFSSQRHSESVAEFYKTILDRSRGEGK